MSLRDLPGLAQRAWHTGWVGAVLRYDALVDAADADQLARDFLRSATRACKQLLR